MQLVCGTPSCGRCYEDELLAAPMPKFKQRAGVEVVYDETAHRKIIRRKRGGNK
jgi:hypothetical protein